jgi:pilus assembly protein TadC
MKIDVDALNEAIDNVATKKFMIELREALIYGPPAFRLVFDEYMKIKEKKDEKEKSAE